MSALRVTSISRLPSSNSAILHDRIESTSTLFHIACTCRSLAPSSRLPIAPAQINIRSARFLIRGAARVLLFTKRAVKAGERLHYDYNALAPGYATQDFV